MDTKIARVIGSSLSPTSGSLTEAKAIAVEQGAKGTGKVAWLRSESMVWMLNTSSIVSDWLPLLYLRHLNALRLIVHPRSRRAGSAGMSPCYMRVYNGSAAHAIHIPTRFGSDLAKVIKPSSRT
uniref:Uncharacterized protein n=1 Tax=Vespula pensylvanica TaxID=30213 RepID=A0A834KPJ6_VESPE|nr:hypothetical protein H0235_013223 [Vespula pensylvanica]